MFGSLGQLGLLDEGRDLILRVVFLRDFRVVS